MKVFFSYRAQQCFIPPLAHFTYKIVIPLGEGSVLHNSCDELKDTHTHGDLVAQL